MGRRSLSVAASRTFFVSDIKECIYSVPVVSLLYPQPWGVLCRNIANDFYERRKNCFCERGKERFTSHPISKLFIKLASFLVVFFENESGVFFTTKPRESSAQARQGALIHCLRGFTAMRRSLARVLPERDKQGFSHRNFMSGLCNKVHHQV